MKKLSAMLLALSCMLLFQAASAFAADSKMETIISKVMGTPYHYGGTTTKGFDCSGFTMYVFNKMDISIARTSSSQSKLGSKVEKSDLLPGDLVFFNTSGRGISHVGIYVGDNKFAHSSSSKGVTISSLSENYYSKRYVTARRVMSIEAITQFTDVSEELLDELLQGQDM